MASYLPPTEDLPIFDSSVFDETNSSYLTYTSAKKLFLTYPTAQGEETIASLISAEIDTATPTTDFNFLQSQTTGDILIGNGLTASGGATIKVGPTGSTGNVSVHCANIDFYNNTINNATDALLNNLNIGGTQTSGVLNIGTGTRIVGGNGGAINIGTGASVTAPINIGGGASSSNTINIGQTGTTTGTTTTNINTSTVGSHPVNIGSSTALTTVNGALTVSGTLTADGGISLPSGDTMTITGNISGAGNITTTGSGTITSAGTLTASSGLSTTSIQSASTSSNIALYDQNLTGIIYIGTSLSRTQPIVMNVAGYDLTNRGTFSSAGLITATSGLTIGGANGITLASSSYTPSSTQLGGYGTNSNSLLQQYTNPTDVDVVSTGANLPVGTFILMYNCTFDSWTNTTSAYMNMSFVLSSGTTLIGLPATLVLQVNGSATASTFVLSVVCKTTAAGAEVNMKARINTGTNAARLSIGKGVVTWIKIG